MKLRTVNSISDYYSLFLFFPPLVARLLIFLKKRFVYLSNFLPSYSYSNDKIAITIQ